MGSDASWNSGGSMQSSTGQHSNSFGGQSTTMTDNTTAQNINEVSGGASESGSSYNNANGSGYSKKSNFNLKNANTQSLTNTKGMSTKFNLGSNSGTTSGTKWNSFGSSKAGAFSKVFVDEPEYLQYVGTASGSDASWNSGGSMQSSTGQHSNS